MIKAPIRSTRIAVSQAERPVFGCSMGSSVRSARWITSPATVPESTRQRYFKNSNRKSHTAGVCCQSQAHHDPSIEEAIFSRAIAAMSTIRIGSELRVSHHMSVPKRAIEARIRMMMSLLWSDTSTPNQGL